MWKLLQKETFLPDIKRLRLIGGPPVSARLSEDLGGGANASRRSGVSLVFANLSVDKVLSQAAWLPGRHSISRTLVASLAHSTCTCHLLLLLLLLTCMTGYISSLRINSTPDSARQLMMTTTPTVRNVIYNKQCPR